MRSGLSRKMSRLDLFSWRCPFTVKQLRIIKPLFHSGLCACGETRISWRKPFGWDYRRLRVSLSEYLWTFIQKYRNIILLSLPCVFSGLCLSLVNRSTWVRGFTVIIAHTAVIFSTGSPGQCGLVDVHLLERHTTSPCHSTSTWRAHDRLYVPKYRLLL